MSLLPSLLIQLTEPEYILYLAIDELVYKAFFQRLSVQAVVSQNQVLLILVDMSKEIIVQWIN